MMSKAVADLIYPDSKKDYADYEEIYPVRTNDETAFTTRLSPSPTGFMHIGGLYAALVNRIIAKRSGGCFYLRIEDTDQKRLVEGGVAEIIKTLNEFGIRFDEGPANETEDYGSYGPYRQSLRREIYHAFAKRLVELDKAYLCFCTEEDTEDIRKKQEEENCNLFGYYGKWAKCRNLPEEEVIRRLQNGEEFIIRLKSDKKEGDTRDFYDGIRGPLNMPENVIDTVLIKRDGLPTYHFAHAVDDHLMRTTDVIRGDEWVSSLPTHVQLFETLGFQPPRYWHISPIMKMDGTSRRKLSKRKDPEARVHSFIEMGYPVKAVIDYLLTIASADFEDWRREHPDADITDFPLDITKTGVAGALFDFSKLDNIAKNCVGAMGNEEIFGAVSEWAAQFDEKLNRYIRENGENFQNSIPVWHERRLDVRKWSDLMDFYPYLYDSGFDNCAGEIPEKIQNNVDDVTAILADYLETYDSADDADVWFSKIKSIAEKYNYATKMGKYKKNPEEYRGSIVDVASYIRYAVTSHFDTPDLYGIISVIGAEESVKRVQNFLEKLKQA